MTYFGLHPPGLAPVRMPASGRATLLTYEPYYGLREKPFSLSVDPRFLYKSNAHASVFDDLLAGIRRREGLIVLTGDIGMGKTTLCRAVLNELDQKTFSTFVPDPFVTREDLLKMLLVDFGVMSVDDLKSGRLAGAARPDLSYPLYEFLNSLVPLQGFAVLIIDEAQNLSLPLLEEIRILSDLEAPEKLIQVVLIGQLELRAKLKLPEMRQVDQRVSVRCQLEALTPEGTAGYIAHRLAVAGGGTDRIRFPSDAIDLIYQASNGVPRLINLICDRSLHRGHLARTPEIDADIVRVALADLGLAAEPVRAPAFPAGDLQASWPAEAHVTENVEAKPAEEKPTTRTTVELKNADSKSSDPATPPITFEEDDLVHAAQAVVAKSEVTAAPEVKPAESAATDFAVGDRGLSLLVESRSSIWNRDKFRRRRGRRRIGKLKAIAATVLVFAAGVSGMSYWQSVGQDLTAPIEAPPLPATQLVVAKTRPAALPSLNTPPVAADQPAALTPPPAVAEHPYAIDVALFNSVERADRLVDELSASGYRAHQRDVNLGERGHLHEVLVGVYPTLEAAETDLARIRAIPGYLDARIVAAP